MQALPAGVATGLTENPGRLPLNGLIETYVSDPSVQSLNEAFLFAPSQSRCVALYKELTDSLDASKSVLYLMSRERYAAYHMDYEESFGRAAYDFRRRARYGLKAYDASW
jgi:hypothetical protein